MFRSSSLYDIVAPTSMGVRLTPQDRQPVQTSEWYRMQATSAESNVLSCGAALGLHTKVLTAFIKDHSISSYIQGELRKRNINYEGPILDQTGPWGIRHQINIADSGFGLHGPSVLNDRAGEVARILKSTDFDLIKLFEQDGVKVLHISGLFASLSEETGTLCLELVNLAKTNNTRVSFDINYRPSFWEHRKSELSDLFHQLAQQSDILIGNEEDFQLALGIPGPEPGGVDIVPKLGQYETMIETTMKQYPNLSHVAVTLREAISANEHRWGAILQSTAYHIVEPIRIPVMDRIGGGDGFVGGLLYGLITGMSDEDSLHFAWANGAYTVTLLNDYSQPLNEDEIWRVWQHNARIRR